MKTNIKSKIIFIGFPLLLASILLFFYIGAINTERIPPSGPTDADLSLENMRSSRCPVWTKWSSEVSEDFRIVDVNCKFLVDNISDDGEDVVVEIYTINREIGISSFKKWLINNDLLESDKLRISYIHKPL